MPIHEIFTETNNYARAVLCPSRRCGKGPRKRVSVTSEAQRRINRIRSAHMMADVINLNMTPAAYVISVDYARQPESYDAAKKDADVFLSKAGALARSRGGKLIYVRVTERGRKSGRYHHHFVVECKGASVSRDELEDLWTRGRVNSRRYQPGETGAVGLGFYLTKQQALVSEGSVRRWSCSRGMVRPEPRVNDYRVRVKDAKYINANPQDRAAVEELYPEWECVGVEPTLCGESVEQLKGVNGGRAGAALLDVPFVVIYLRRAADTANNNSGRRSK